MDLIDKDHIQWLKDEIQIAKLQNNLQALRSLEKELSVIEGSR